MQAYITLQILVILGSKVKFDKMYMKMSKYENSVFPYFVHSTVNLPALRPKDTNITMSFLRLFTETIILERKGFFSRNIVKIDETHEESSTSQFET